MSVPATPPDRIKLLMNQDNLTQRELGVKLDVDESLISKYLSPKGAPSAKFLTRLEDKLRWSARWIRTGEGPPRLAIVNNESVNVVQPGKRNQSNVNYKGGDQTIQDSQDEVARLRQELQEERIRNLQREKELQDELIQLLKAKNK